MKFLFRKYKKLMIFLIYVHSCKTTYFKNGESIITLEFHSFFVNLNVFIDASIIGNVNKQQFLSEICINFISNYTMPPPYNF